MAAERPQPSQEPPVSPDTAVASPPDTGQSLGQRLLKNRFGIRPVTAGDSSGDVVGSQPPVAETAAPPAAPQRLNRRSAVLGLADRFGIRPVTAGDSSGDVVGSQPPVTKTAAPRFKRRPVVLAAGLGAAALAGLPIIGSRGRLGPDSAHASESASGPGPATLAEVATRAGKTVGVDMAGGIIYNDQKLKATLSSEFSRGVVVHGAHWRLVEPKRGEFDFTVMRKYIDFAKANGLKVRVQPLLWPNPELLPDWLKNGNFSSQEMEAIIRNHVTSIVTELGDDADQVTVVNEPHKVPWNRDLFADAFGGGLDYVTIAVDAARKANPNITIIVNDNHNESEEPGRFSLVGTSRKVLENLRAAGLVDDKFRLGIQGHIKWAKGVPHDIASVLQSYGGVKTVVTECDIDMSGAPGTPEEREALQAEMLIDYLGQVEASGTCDEYGFWGLGDENSVQERATNPQRNPDADPTIFRNNLDPKLAYGAFRDFLERLASGRNELANVR